MRPLATLSGRASAKLILEVLALPLQTHGTMDGWKRIQPLEIMLFEGASCQTINARDNHAGDPSAHLKVAFGQRAPPQYVI